MRVTILFVTASDSTFEVTIQVGDPSVKPEEHFGTLLKKGTYVIRCDGSSEPQSSSATVLKICTS